MSRNLKEARKAFEKELSREATFDVSTWFYQQAGAGQGLAVDALAHPDLGINDPEKAFRILSALASAIADHARAL